MFAASTFEEIERQERLIDTKQLVVFLFVKPNSSSNLEIVKEFEYIHYNSDGYCSVYAIGYTNDFSKSNDKTYKRIQNVCNTDWFFSNKAFVDFKDKLEPRIKWKYSGETEMLLLQNNTETGQTLNFQNYVALNINKGIREGYIDSFQAFMESLVRSAKRNVTAKEVINEVLKSRISIKNIVSSAIDDCKSVPTPVRSIVKDELFYRSANMKSLIKV